MISFDNPKRARAFLVLPATPNQIATGAPQTTVANLPVQIEHSIEKSWLTLNSFCIFHSGVSCRALVKGSGSVKVLASDSATAQG